MDGLSEGGLLLVKLFLQGALTIKYTIPTKSQG